MLKYRVLKKYQRFDNTLNEGDIEEIEFPITDIPFDCSENAREYLKCRAYKEHMRIYNGKDWRITAEKVTTTEDIESGIITTEIETLRIEAVA